MLFIIVFLKELHMVFPRLQPSKSPPLRSLPLNLNSTRLSPIAQCLPRQKSSMQQIYMTLFSPHKQSSFSLRLLSYQIYESWAKHGTKHSSLIEFLFFVLSLRVRVLQYYKQTNKQNKTNRRLTLPPFGTISDQRTRATWEYKRASDLFYEGVERHEGKLRLAVPRSGTAHVT